MTFGSDTGHEIARLRAERARLRAALTASEAQRLDAAEWGNALEDKLYGALGECDRLRAALARVRNRIDATPKELDEIDAILAEGGATDG